ncbi:hypothetical protein [Nocardioides currus]|uniref:Uncharacterized protein n=1 Tax=Nocardioides currus TaxID=2133958 RepID=A0A2R7Z068_9ACTN|nr:hypothetical protein [Nocardioides currus]PUA82013.1 hypothetical protein C7S10_08230 [Nocardioides currus]
MTAWRTWSRSQVVCRVLVALLPVLALFTADVRPNAVVLLVTVVLSVLWACFPELAAGQIALLVVMAWWALSVPDPLQPGVLASALALVSAHVSAVLAAYGPARLQLDPRLVTMWVRRTLLSFVAAPVAYAAVVVLDDPDRVMWPLAVGVLAVLVVVVGMRFRDPSGTSSV